MEYMTYNSKTAQQPLHLRAPYYNAINPTTVTFEAEGVCLFCFLQGTNPRDLGAALVAANPDNKWLDVLRMLLTYPALLCDLSQFSNTAFYIGISVVAAIFTVITLITRKMFVRKKVKKADYQSVCRQLKVAEEYYWTVYKQDEENKKRWIEISREWNSAYARAMLQRGYKTTD